MLQVLALHPGGSLQHVASELEPLRQENSTAVEGESLAVEANTELGNGKVPTQNQHKCQICNKVFGRKRNLNNHLVCHEVDRPFSCRLCDTLFVYKSHLLRHMKTHGSANTPSQCKICGITFSRASSITNHMKIHNCIHVTVPVKIDLTANEITIDNTLAEINSPPNSSTCENLNIEEIFDIEILESRSSEDFPCEHSDHSFRDANALTEHTAGCGRVQNSVDNANSSGTISDGAQENPKHDVVVKHFTNKVNKHGCTECGKRFSTTQKLLRHMLVHRRKTYTCEVCYFGFDEKDDLDMHRRVSHPPESGYVCKKCGKSFSSRQGLREHKRAHKSLTYQCEDCSKLFTSKQGYVIHQRKHRNERPYRCRVCLKAFRDGGTLRKHEVIHSGEKPHACALCANTFNQKVSLRQHMRWVHAAKEQTDAEGLYQCRLCTQKLTDQDELCAHFIKHQHETRALAKDASESNVEDENSSSEISE